MCGRDGLDLATLGALAVLGVALVMLVAAGDGSDPGRGAVTTDPSLAELDRETLSLKEALGLGGCVLRGSRLWPSSRSPDLADGWRKREPPP